MTTQYVMKATLSIGPGGFVYWAILGTPDFTGEQSGYNPADLTGIAIDYSFQVSINGEGGITPIGLVGGDLSGTLPNPVVVQIQAKSVSATAPTNQEALVYNGSNYVPASVQIVYNVMSYGAVGNGIVDDSAAIQAAINAAAAQNGGTVFFPNPSTYYAVANTIVIGSAGAPVSGIVLESGRRGLAGDDPIIVWTGATGGDNAIIKIREAHSCSITNLSFSGNNKADYCIQWHMVNPPDTFQVEHWIVTGVSYANARKYNVLIGEPDGTSSDSDESEILHIGCYFQQSFMGAQTIAHVRHRSYNSLDNSFINCQFYGSGTYPLYGVYISSGRVSLHDCVADVLGEVDFYMDNDPGINPGSLYVSSFESQSRRLLIGASPDGTDIRRSTVLINCFHNDIINNGDGYSISWGFEGAALELVGCNMSRNQQSSGSIQITNPRANVYTTGTTFDYPGDGFTGYVNTVSGSYRDGYSRMLTLTPSTVYNSYQLDQWGINYSTNTSAVVIGSGAAFGTITNGEYFGMALNGLPTVTITLTGADTTLSAVANAIQNAFVNVPCVSADSTSTQLRLTAQQSVSLIAGSAGTLAKLGLVAGTTYSPGIYPIAVMEGTQTLLYGDGYMALGSDALAGLLTVVCSGGISINAAVGVFVVNGGGHTLTPISDPETFFHLNSDTSSGKINIYWDSPSAQYLIHNMYDSVGESLFISVSLNGIGQH